MFTTAKLKKYKKSSMFAEKFNNLSGLAIQE